MAYVDERSERSTTINKYIDYYVPIYEYVVDGKVFHAEAREYSNNSAKFQHGSKCTIKYNPNKPGECFINGKKCKKVLEYENEPEES